MRKTQTQVYWLRSSCDTSIEVNKTRSLSWFGWRLKQVWKPLTLKRNSVNEKAS